MKTLLLLAASLAAFAQAPGAVRYLSYGGAPTAGDCTLALAGARVGVDTSTTPDTVYDCIDGSWVARPVKVVSGVPTVINVLNVETGSSLAALSSNNDSPRLYLFDSASNLAAFLKVFDGAAIFQALDATSGAMGPLSFAASTTTIQDTTATTGSTKLVVKAGAGQASNLQEWQDAAGNVQNSVANAAFTAQNGSDYASFSAGDGAQGAFLDTSGYVAFNTLRIKAQNVAQTATGPYAINASTLTIQDDTATTGDTKFVVKAGAGQAGNLQEWQDAAGTVVGSISSTGSAHITSSTANFIDLIADDGVVIRAADSSGQVSFASTAMTVFNAAGDAYAPYLFQVSTMTLQDPTAATGDTKLVVKAGAGQASNLQEWQDAAGTTLAYVNPYGNFWQEIVGDGTFSMGVDGGGYVQLTNATNVTQLFPGVLRSNLSSDSSSDALTINASTTTIQDTTATTGDTKLVVKAGAGQAGNLQEWQDAAGNSIAFLGSGGFTFGTYPDQVGFGTDGPPFTALSTTDSKMALGAYGIDVVDGPVSSTGGPFYLHASTTTIQDPTDTTGDTKLVVKAGAGQASNLQEWQDAAGTATASIFQADPDLTNGIRLASAANSVTLYSYTSGSYGEAGFLSTAIGGGTGAIGVWGSQLSFGDSLTFTPLLQVLPSTGTVVVEDQTAMTGETTLQVNLGAAQTDKSVVLATAGRMQAPLTTPTTSAETCTAGTFTADTGYIYVCTAASTWKRAALSAF